MDTQRIKELRKEFAELNKKRDALMQEHAQVTTHMVEIQGAIKELERVEKKDA